jgi:hypothetical protein
MARRSTTDEPGGAPIGSRQGGAPLAKGLDEIEAGKVHKTRTERSELIANPNLNQAGNEAGSFDQAQGSQTGNDVDLIPERDLLDRK